MIFREDNMKNILIFTLSFLFLLVPEVFGIDRNWSNDSSDRLWRNKVNWSGGVLPGGGDKAGIRNNFENDGPVIDQYTNALANVVVIGDWGSTVDAVEMNGGTLKTNDWLILGYGANNDGTLTVADGDVNVGGLMHVGLSGTGTLNISAGTISVSSSLNIAKNTGSTGQVNLKGGVINANSFSMTSGGTLDIENGTLVINNDVTSTIITYINNGWIIGYGGDVTPKVDYGTSNPGKTTVRANKVVLQAGIGDVDGDRDVDVIDLSLFSGQWLQGLYDPDADFSRDNHIDIADFGLLAKNWLYEGYSSTLTGKIMCGYQGWFNYPGDGADLGWVHWGKNGKFEPGYCSVDMWPDMDEYDEDEKKLTPFKYADGSAAHVFSSYNEKTVLRHFSWMEEYGIDGIFLQRFANGITPGSNNRAHKDRVMLNCRKGANLHSRAWAMMYDLSGLNAGECQRVIDDWKYLVDTFGVSKDPADQAYLYHNGKPVVAIWGLGFDREYEGQGTYELIDFLKNDSIYGGCTVMIGVQNSWLTNPDTWFQQIVQLADIISPWAVGRYGSIYESELNNFTARYTVPDQLWCKANGKDYLPVVFPGFSWQNLKGEKFDHIPRRGGTFLWRQYYKAIQSGATMVYQAMFDEVDEGTAIFKCTNNPPVAESPAVVSTPFLPTGNAQYSPYNLNDAQLPSDQYLWLVGEAGKMLRGETGLTEIMPVRE